MLSITMALVRLPTKHINQFNPRNLAMRYIYKNHDVTYDEFLSILYDMFIKKSSR